MSGACGTSPGSCASSRRALLAGLAVVCFSLPARADLDRDRGMPVPRREEVPIEPRERPGAAPPPGKAPAAPPKKADEEGGFVAVPLALYSPETHFGLGGFGLHHFRFAGEPVESRVSSIAAVAFATTRRQLILELLPELYWDNNGFHVDGKLEYQYFPDSFWGIGDDAPTSAEERYIRERVRTRGIGRRRLVGPLYLGLHWDAMGFFPTIRETDGLFATTAVPGEAGGATIGVGPTAQFDTRDNTVESRSGTLLSVTYDRFDAIIGSRYDFDKLVLDARHFFPLGREHAIGARFYGEINGGEVPFYMMGMIGGDELLRGYFLGRYRDKWLGALEAEYRFPIVWRFRGVVFAGAAEVADRLTHVDLDPIRWTAGTGLRLALNQKERLNLRVDFGAGVDTYGFYLSASEAF